MRLRAGFCAALILAAAPAAARTLLVGAGREYALPSEAIAAAHEGDTVSIAPGEYFDCSIVRTDRLTLVGEGDGPQAAMTDKVCEEKAVLVLRGTGTTIRNLTLQRARAPDGNGAGIRLEGADLSVDHVRFLNDQVGILSGSGGGQVSVVDSKFEQGGVGGVQPKYALMIAHSALLRVQGCTFEHVKGGQITTAADRSDIVDDSIGVGAGDAEEDPSYAVLATAGELLMEHDVITVGPLPPRSGAAIGVWDGASALIQHSRMVNNTGRSLAFVKDWSWGEPKLVDDAIGAQDSLSSSSGVWRHRASNQFYERKAQAHDLASQAKQMIKRALGR